VRGPKQIHPAQSADGDRRQMPLAPFEHEYDAIVTRHEPRWAFASP
jgi:hypothetical protein